MKHALAEFLFEIGCEEIPAGMIPGAAKELQVILNKYLSAENLLEGAAVEAFGAPRRLVATCQKVRLKQDDVEREVTGPPKAIAFDPEGRPTRAAESFAAKQGVPLTSLYLIHTPRGEYLAAKLVSKGKSAVERLGEILPRAVSEIPWPKTMYWTGASGQRFIRPIRWIVALLGKERLRFEVAGVPASASTVGHRFLGKPHIPVTGVRDYLTRLRTNFVLAHPEERRKKVERELSRLVSRKGLRVNDDPWLANLVVYLNEFPTAIAGDFDPAYLTLPDEILLTVMRGHQKYFGVRRRDGKIGGAFPCDHQSGWRCPRTGARRT